MNKLFRSRDQRILAGVCGGLAEYLNMDPTIVRVIYALVTLFTGFVFGALAYIVMLLLIPENN